ncbi:hypothetical protein [Microvirga alba]|uniref:Lipoprotein n=1 Tax=Microvirga alba TaxID=2791025 RepID=A0A931BMK2_9HYPH|nr:hypothetical protein [Microvirga alba]MBF9234001.1 hypothetical protein [Microvirga alba]
MKTHYLLLSLSLASLAGCATESATGNFTAGQEVRGEVLAHWTQAAFEKELEQRGASEQALMARVMGPAIRAGRVVQYRCAQGKDDAVIANAILPTGLQVRRGEVVRIRVGDASSAIANQVTGKETSPRLQRGSFGRPGSAVELTPWAGYMKEGPIEPWIEQEYFRAPHFRFLIKCTAPA